MLARGDRRICAVIYEAFKLGCKFDSWGEYFHFDVWMKAFENCGVDPKFYANRRREYTEVLPWSHIDIGIPEGYFMNESIKAKPARQRKTAAKNATAAAQTDCLGGPATDGILRHSRFYKKVGDARYISHLDLSRFMQRSLKRTGLPLWHTEGFNPHPYVTFALPLSVGQSGQRETMDFRLVSPVPTER